MARYPGARRAVTGVYTQDDLATIKQALNRPLSEARTQQLQQCAYEYRWAEAQQSEVQRFARARKQYETLLKHLQAIETDFDAWDKIQQMDFAQHWNKAAPRIGSPSGEASDILQMLSQFDHAGQVLKFMCEGILENLPHPTNSNPLHIFIRQLAYIYKEETGGNPTAYDPASYENETDFLKFARACIRPIKPKRAGNALYKMIQRALN